MASPLFFKRLRHDLGLELLLNIHLAQPGVLGLQFLHARHQRHIHAAELRAPLVERRRADPQFAAQLGHGQTGLDTLDGLDDLTVRESRLLHHVELLNEKILLLTTSLFREDYPASTASAAPRTTSGRANTRACRCPSCSACVSLKRRTPSSNACTRIWPWRTQRSRMC